MQLQKYIELLIKSKIKRISLDELYMVLANDNVQKAKLFKQEQYDEFFDVVSYLIKNEILEPYGSKKNTKSKSLYLKYHVLINKNDKSTISQSHINELYGLHKDIKNLDYYMNRPDDYGLDREYILKLDTYLKNKSQSECKIGVYERSYQIFGDEKFIKNPSEKTNRGEKILNHLGLSIQDLNCYENSVPMLCFIRESFYRKPIRKILIVENLDTYWTFQRRMSIDNSINDINLLLFGQGYAIVGTFAEYENYGIKENDHILYFGDIDSEGFKIFKQFKDKYSNLNIELAAKYYEMAVEIVKGKEISQIKNKQEQIDASVLDELLKGLNDTTKLFIIDLIKMDRYIPQEALNYKLLKETETHNE